MSFDAFISYSSRDKPAADAACATLEQAGIRCWIAPRDIRPGQDWDESIVRAIDQCHAMVLIFTQHTNESKHVGREVKRAFNKEVPVIPMRVQNAVPSETLSFYLDTVQWLDAYTPPLEQHLKQLSETVKAILNVEPQCTFGVPIAKRRVLEQVYRFDEYAYVDEDKQTTQDISPELFEDWWNAFRNGFLCAFQDDKPVAVVGLFPVTETWSSDFLKYRVSEHDLSGAIINEAKKSACTHWYLSGLSSAMKPRTLSKHLPRILGYALLAWMRFNACSIGTRNIVIASEGTTTIGEKLLCDLFKFKLADHKMPAGGKPRFSTETNLDQIKNILTKHRFFLSCPDLQEEIALMTITSARDGGS